MFLPVFWSFCDVNENVPLSVIHLLTYGSFGDLLLVSVFIVMLLYVPCTVNLQR